MSEIKNIEQYDGIELPSTDPDAITREVNNTGKTGTLFPTVKFTKKGMEIVMGENKKKVEKIENARILFQTQKFELVNLEDPKKIQTIAYSSEYFGVRKQKCYVFIIGEDSIEAPTLSDAKQEIENRRVADTKKIFYNVFYIDTPDGIMRMYLRHTQVGGAGGIMEPTENTAKKIIEANAYSDKLYDINITSYESEAGSDVYFPEFIEKKQEKDKSFITKMADTMQKILEQEKKNVKEVKEQVPATNDEDEIPF